MNGGIKTTLASLLVVLLTVTVTLPARADTKALIDANTERALEWLADSSRPTKRLLKNAAGVLVFGDVVKMGFGLGGEFGEGALIVDGKIVEYYAVAGKKFGVGTESRYKAEVIVFKTERALKSFRKSVSWKVGKHAVVPVVRSAVKPGKLLKSDAPIVGFVFTEAGVIAGIGLDGNKVTRISR